MEDTKLKELILKNKNVLTLVEGKKDVESLRKLGFKRIKTVQEPEYKVVEGIREEVQILTDLDREGKRIFNRLRNQLQRRGIKINNQIRLELFKTQVRTVESLYKYLERREDHGREAV